MRCGLAALAALCVFSSGTVCANPAAPDFEPRLFANWVFGGAHSQQLFQAGLQFHSLSGSADPESRPGAVPAWLDVRVLAQGVSVNLGGLPLARSLMLRQAEDGTMPAGAQAAEPWYQNGWLLGIGAVGAAAVVYAVSGGGGGSSGSPSSPSNSSSSGSGTSGTCVEVAGTQVGVGGQKCVASIP